MESKALLDGVRGCPPLLNETVELAEASITLVLSRVCQLGRRLSSTYGCNMPNPAPPLAALC